MTGNHVRTPYAKELCAFVVKLNETHTMGAIVALVKNKKTFSKFDRKRFCKSSGHNMVARVRTRNGNGNGNGNSITTLATKKRKFASKLILPGGIVMELAPGQVVQVSGKQFSIKLSKETK